VVGAVSLSRIVHEAVRRFHFTRTVHLRSATKAGGVEDTMREVRNDESARRSVRPWTRVVWSSSALSDSRCSCRVECRVRRWTLPRCRRSNRTSGMFRT